jgi:hypothetical protein
MIRARDSWVKDRDKHIANLNKGLAEQAQTVIKLRADLERRDKVIEAYQIKNEFISKAGRETMIVKVGSVEHKWMPSPAQFAAITKRIKNSKIDEKYNILLTHAFTEAHIL